MVVWLIQQAWEVVLQVSHRTRQASYWGLEVVLRVSVRIERKQYEKTTPQIHSNPTAMHPMIAIVRRLERFHRCSHQDHSMFEQFRIWFVWRSWVAIRSWLNVWRDLVIVPEFCNCVSRRSLVNISMNRTTYRQDTQTRKSKICDKKYAKIHKGLKIGCSPKQR